MTYIYTPSTPPIPSPFTLTIEHLDLNFHVKGECLEAAPNPKDSPRQFYMDSHMDSNSYLPYTESKYYRLTSIIYL